MASCEKILITGFSGSGKSTLLKKVKEHLAQNWPRINDLDQLILKKHSQYKTIQQLVEAQSWETFRLWERQELESWLKDEGKGILALGGGTLNPMLFDLLRSNRKIKFCFLDAPFEECWKRLLGDGGEARPLVKLGKEALKKIYQERKLVFDQIPWKITSGSEEEVVNSFLKDCLKEMP